MAAMAMASFPFTNKVSGLRSSTFPPHSDGHIRTNLSADGAPGAFPIVIPAGTKIAVLIHLFADVQQLFGA
jgi:hypothetical protein